MIRTQSLSYRYGATAALHFPDLVVATGESLLILGPSGAGKTTLMHLLAGLLKPLSGSVAINGVEINTFTQKEVDRFRGKHIGLIFQRPHFIKTLSLLENLLLIRHLAGLPQSKSHCLEYLHKLGISHKTNNLPYSMSQGEQQRAGIAMALVNNPAVVLADEPTSSLDDANARRVTELLQVQTSEAGATLVVISHDSRVKKHFSNHVAL